MRHLRKICSALLVLIAFSASAQTKTVGHFSKIIVSPYIQVKFVQGNNESVTINDISVDTSKLHIEVDDNTLRVYLDGAKDIPKNEKDYSKGYKETYPLYKKTSVVATITYKNLEALSIRGEETHVVDGPINGDDFALRIYGESEVTFSKMNLNSFAAVLYGEGKLNIESGSIQDQRYTCYGEGEINALAIKNSTSNILAYGDADFKLNTCDKIKIVAFGDAKLHYKGSAEIDKGLHFGDMKIDKID